jgi:hypothetical protein
MIIFLNWKNSQGRETVDQLDSKSFSNYSAFRSEKSRLLLEYSMAFNSNTLYWSSRCCKNWK